jgi:ribonuclease PH
MIGRSLRAAVDLTKLGDRTIIIDCDVIQADGGTRTACVTGGYVALAIALRKLIHAREVPRRVLRVPVAGVSVGILDGVPLLDLCYSEDSMVEVDLNVVMTSRGEYVELQGAAEGQPFGRDELSQLLQLAEEGISELLALQRKALQESDAQTPGS